MALKIPPQLVLLDSEAAELLAALLDEHGSCFTSRVLDVVASLNSREALLACLTCALVAYDDGTTERALDVEQHILALRRVLARVRKEPIPETPTWLRIVQQMCAQAREDDEASEDNSSMRGQVQETLHVPDAAVISCAEAGKIQTKVNADAESF